MDLEYGAHKNKSDRIYSTDSHQLFDAGVTSGQKYICTCISLK